MILDEKLDMVIIKPVRVSHGGGTVEATMLEMSPPLPTMASYTYKMNKYFGQLAKTGIALAADLMGTEKIQEHQELKLEAGNPVVAVHEEYADDDDVAREKKIKAIEDEVKQFSGLIDICEKIDLFRFASDFGKMIVEGKRCKLKVKAEQGEKDGLVPMTLSIWQNDIDPRDRIAVAIKYCCFFGLTSSLPS